MRALAAVVLAACGGGAGTVDAPPIADAAAVDASADAAGCVLPEPAACLYATTAHDTSYWDYSTGFRCCATP